MKTERFKHFLDQQKKEINKFKWDKGRELGRDPGSDAAKEWVTKYACKFRKNFAVGDIKNALSDLRVIRTQIQEHMEKITALTEILNNCEEKILEGLELLEGEKD